MCVNIGHGNKRVIKAIQDQAAELCYAGPSMATKVRAEFGPLLSKYTPGDLKKFFFTLGGAEANENAIKMARFHTGRNKIIARYRSYHGATHGAIQLTGDPRRWPNEPGMGGVIRAFDPYMYRSHLYQEGMPEEEFSAKCLQQLEETIMYEGPQNIAAMFIETVTGTNGIIPPPAGYLPGLRKLLDKYGILLVCDEVMCGLGRTGAWFAVDHWNVVPDIITMAKGITSAYVPLGVVAVSKKIAATFDDRVYSGGLTYSGHPLSLACANETIRVMEDEKLVENAREMGKVMKDLHQQMKAKHKSVGDVRSIGLFGAIELVKNRKTKEPLVPFGGSAPVAGKIANYFRDNGIYVHLAGHLLLTNPPLCINKKQLEETFEVIDRALDIADEVYQE